MARRHQPAAAEALEELEGVADRLGDWLQENLRLVVAAVAGVLALAGLAAWIISARESVENEASLAFAATRGDYLEAMGASPDALEAPELANPEAAAQIRSEYRERFDELTARYEGTVAGTLAALESARIAEDAGEPDQAIATLESALDNAPDRPALRGIVLQRIAQSLETAARWEEASRRHEQAAEIEGYPLRDWALADAARCAAKAGDRDRALALYDRLEADYPQLRLPDYQQAEVEDLRAARDAS